MRSKFKYIVGSSRLVWLVVLLLIFIIAYISCLYFKEKVNDIDYINEVTVYEVESILDKYGCASDILTLDENIYGAEHYLNTTDCELNIKYTNFSNGDNQDKYFNEVLKDIQVNDRYKEKIYPEHLYSEYIFEEDRFVIVVRNGDTILHANTSVRNQDEVLDIFLELGYYYTGYQNRNNFYKNVMLVVMVIDIFIIIGLFIVPFKKNK